MSAKTKIVVLHKKELIYTGIFVLLGVLFIILLVMMFLPKSSETDSLPQEDAPVSSGSVYVPGIYTTELVLGNQSLDVEVIVTKDSITSIRLVNLNEAVATMYPLLEPTLDSLCEQVYTAQTLEGITYTADNKYTSLVLLEAIRNSIDKASVK